MYMCVFRKSSRLVHTKVRQVCKIQENDWPSVLCVSILVHPFIEFPSSRVCSRHFPYGEASKSLSVTFGKGFTPLHCSHKLRAATVCFSCGLERFFLTPLSQTIPLLPKKEKFRKGWLVWWHNHSWPKTLSHVRRIPSLLVNAVYIPDNTCHCMYVCGRVWSSRVGHAILGTSWDGIQYAAIDPKNPE